MQNQFNGNKNIVLLVASDVRPAGRFTEFYMLMEFCPGARIVMSRALSRAGGHVVDLMQRRVARPFSEEEILKACRCQCWCDSLAQIIGDTALGLHALHHAVPAIIHRDIKVRAPSDARPISSAQPENVLLSQGDTSFKLCDFGSATTATVTPGLDAPVGIVEEEIEKFTTLQAALSVCVCRSSHAVPRAGDGGPVPRTRHQHQR